MDLHGKTTVADVMDICCYADLLIGQQGHMVAIGEALDKQTIIIFPHRYKKSSTTFISDCHPKKFINKKVVTILMDNESTDTLKIAMEVVIDGIMAQS